MSRQEPSPEYVAAQIALSSATNARGRTFWFTVSDGAGAYDDAVAEVCMIANYIVSIARRDEVEWGETHDLTFACDEAAALFAREALRHRLSMTDAEAIAQRAIRSAKEK